MPDLSDIDLGRRARRLRVDTLVRLRWLAIAGQLAAVLGTYFGLRFNLPDRDLVLLRHRRLGGAERRAAPALAAHAPACRSPGRGAARLRHPAALGAAYLTGGIENPFVMLFLAPVMISAVSLPKPADARARHA